VAKHRGDQMRRGALGAQPGRARHRLKLASSEKNIFSADAINLTHEHATGALRDIDRIAHGAMRDAARRKRKTVDHEAVERVLAGRMPIA
jgi:histone H3/H4